MNDNDDLISRQALKQAMYHEAFEVDSDMQKWDGGCWIRYRLFEKIVDIMPSVQPEQKTGRWIYTNTIGGMRYYGCAICANQEKDCIADEHEIQWYNYCPNCGARMDYNTDWREGNEQDNS